MEHKTPSCVTQAWAIPFTQVSLRAAFSLLKVPSVLHWFLRAGGKGQPFPPVLHLMENLNKCSERKKIRGKATIVFLVPSVFEDKDSIWCQQRLWIPWGSTQLFWAVLPDFCRPWGAKKPTSCDVTEQRRSEKPKVLPGEPLTLNPDEFETQLNSTRDFLFCSCSTRPAQPNPKAGVELWLKKSCPSTLCCVPVLV